VPKYLIHACKPRKWYVNDYLIPSMTDQGIPDYDIAVWLDGGGNGNLRSFIDCMKMVDRHYPKGGGIWHLQDDIVISSKFAEETAKNDSGIVCGYCNEKFDGGNVNYVGIMPVAYTWFSFPCIHIPNRYAGEFVDWFENDVITNGTHMEFVSEGKHDDALFKCFLAERHSNEITHNLITNLVDHVDYLIGGSIANKQRGEGDGDSIRRAYRFEEPDVVDALEKKLCRRSKRPSRR